ILHFVQNDNAVFRFGASTFQRMMSSLAVLHASQLVTLAGPNRPRTGTGLSELGIIRDGGMLVRHGKIERIGSSDEIEKNVADAEIVDARGRVVMPGFVDAHTHLVFAGNRLDDFERRARGETYEQIAKAGGGIWSTVEKTRAASERDLLAQVKKHANWFLRCGTMTAEAKSGYGLTVNDQLTNSGGAKLMAEMGATTADHLEQTDEQGIVALKKANVQPVLLPGSVYALGSSRYPRTREMIEAGLAIVLATDFNPGSSPTPS